MFELSAGNAASYLESRGLPSNSYRVAELGGGVSNTVLLVVSPRGRMVLKQSLGKLRVEQDWFSDRARIFRESLSMRMLARDVGGCIPEVVFEDWPNYLFAMTAAPEDARTWKAVLLSGTVDGSIAEQIGRLLGRIVRTSWRHPDWEAAFGDQTVFDQLRLDPYYRSTAARHPDLAPCFERLIRAAQSRRLALVHGDWSPKNFLVAPNSLIAIDFEVIHFGDPAFDTAFLLNHLLLKSFYRPELHARLAAAAHRFWTAYTSSVPQAADPAELETTTVAHLGGLLLARIDGKSPAEYIREEQLRNSIRTFARRLILDPPSTVAGVFERL